MHSSAFQSVADRVETIGACCNEIAALIRGEHGAAQGDITPEEPALRDIRAAAPAQPRVLTPYDADRTQPWGPSGELHGQSHTWPPAVTERYSPFLLFETMDIRGTVEMGLGYADQEAIDASNRKRPYVVVFEVIAREKRRPVVVFTATDESDGTGDFVAVIKGKGAKGTEMFAPGDQLPPVYDTFQIERFRDRVSGPYSYNRLAVVAPGGDETTMLDHALIQMRMRGF